MFDTTFLIILNLSSFQRCVTNIRSHRRQKDVPTTALPEDKINRIREIVAAFLCKEVVNVVGKFRHLGCLVDQILPPLERWGHLIK